MLGSGLEIDISKILPKKNSKRTSQRHLLLDEASTAESSHGKISTTRKIMEKLQPFVSAIEQYNDAVNVYSSTYSLALGPIWGSIKVLLHIAREFGKYFDKLVDMFVRIGDVLPRFKTYERLFQNHDRLIQALSVAYLDIITFCANAKAVFRRGQRSSKTTLKMTFKLLWKPFEQQFGQQLSDFRQHQKNVEKEARIAHMIESADARAVVLADQKQLDKRRRDENRLRILAMLHAIDYEAKHRRLRNLRQAGTGDWLFQHDQYIEWETSGGSAFLCCRGIPGCGKSVLASNLVDHLNGSALTSLATARDLVYYYCDYADQRTLQFDRILGSLLKQLLSGHEVPESIETQILQAYAGGTKSPAESALSAIFCSIVALHPGLYITIDGLDECEKPVWQALLQLLKRLGDIPQSNSKTFITCVEEGSVSHQLADSACLQLSPAVTIQDMNVFVISSVRSKIEQGDLKLRNPRLEQEIISELETKANGMFLWVFFQLQDLCDSASDAEIRETLKNLPDGLGSTYRRILSKIGKTHSRAKIAQKVLKWVTVARRPLHVQELKEAVGIRPEDKVWDDDKFPHETFMFESCRGLIVKNEENDTVHFAHHTVRQYLTGGLTTKVDPSFEVSIRDADLLAGQICVAYLLFSDFDTQITSNKPMATLDTKGVFAHGGPLWIPSILGIRKSMFDLPYKILKGDPVVPRSGSNYWKTLLPQSQRKYGPSDKLKDKYRLLCYSIEYWEPHTRRLDSNIHPSRRFETLVKYKTLAFDFRPWGTNDHFGPHGCVGCPNSEGEKTVAKDLPYMSMIHYAAAVGNVHLLRSISAATVRDYIHHERYHQESMLIACRHNQVEVVKYLIGQAAYDIHNRKAVTAAEASSLVEVLKFLLDISEYPVKQDGEIPLVSAARNGHEDVVMALLEAGADPDNCDKQTRQTIMESAAIQGNDQLIRAMNNRGARDSYFDNQQSAFRLAAANGHVAATRALLETSPSNFRTISCIGPALDLAAKSGYSSVVDFLLELEGVEVDDQDFEFDELTLQKRAIHAAARNGHINVLESLQRKGRGGVLAQNYEGEAPIHSAIAGSQYETMRWLVENGADVNAVDNNGDSPLCHAICNGNVTAVQELLGLGAKITLRKAPSGPETILYLAATDQQLPILRVLLDDLRESQTLPNGTKRKEILFASHQAHKLQSEQAAALLDQESTLYPG